MNFTYQYSSDWKFPSLAITWHCSQPLRLPHPPLHLCYPDYNWHSEQVELIWHYSTSYWLSSCKQVAAVTSHLIFTLAYLGHPLDHLYLSWCCPDSHSAPAISSGSYCRGADYRAAIVSWSLWKSTCSSSCLLQRHFTVPCLSFTTLGSASY